MPEPTIDFARLRTQANYMRRQGRRRLAAELDAAISTAERVPALLAATDELRGWVEWTASFLADDCRYDHHGYCQNHGLDMAPCPVGLMKAHLAEVG